MAVGMVAILGRLIVVCLVATIVAFKLRPAGLQLRGAQLQRGRSSFKRGRHATVQHGAGHNDATAWQPVIETAFQRCCRKQRVHVRVLQRRRGAGAAAGGRRRRAASVPVDVEHTSRTAGWRTSSVAVAVAVGRGRQRRPWACSGVMRGRHGRVAWCRSGAALAPQQHNGEIGRYWRRTGAHHDVQQVCLHCMHGIQHRHGRAGAALRVKQHHMPAVRVITREDARDDGRRAGGRCAVCPTKHGGFEVPRLAGGGVVQLTQKQVRCRTATRHAAAGHTGGAERRIVPRLRLHNIGKRRKVLRRRVACSGGFGHHLYKGRHTCQSEHGETAP